MAKLSAQETSVVEQVCDNCKAKGINFAKLMEMILQLLALFAAPSPPPTP